MTGCNERKTTIYYTKAGRAWQGLYRFLFFMMVDKNKPLRWRNLSDDLKVACRKKGIANGCGPKFKWLPVPQWFFNASCDHHDFNYWLGCEEEDRKRADLEFYEAMCVDVKNQERWYRMRFAQVMSWLYYRAVRWGGKNFFYYGVAERGWEDLEKKLGREI